MFTGRAVWHSNLFLTILCLTVQLAVVSPMHGAALHTAGLTGCRGAVKSAVALGRATVARLASASKGLPLVLYVAVLQFNFSTTADLELAYLESKYPNLLSPSDARDFYKCFQQTALAHFGSNLVLNAIIYNSRGLSAPQPCDKQLLFAGLAQQTGGMLMQPESRSAATMADGLLSVVKALMGRMRGGIVAPQHQQDEDMAQNRDSAGAGERLVGFKLIDLSGVHPDRSSEWEPAGVVDYGDTEELFNIAMDRMVAGKEQSA